MKYPVKHVISLSVVHFLFKALPKRWTSVTAPVCALLGVTSRMDQVRGNGAADNAQHHGYDRRLDSGESKE